VILLPSRFLAQPDAAAGRKAFPEKSAGFSQLHFARSIAVYRLARRRAPWHPLSRGVETFGESAVDISEHRGRLLTGGVAERTVSATARDQAQLHGSVSG
jgi:hypothetical protein